MPKWELSQTRARQGSSWLPMTSVEWPVFSKASVRLKALLARSAGWCPCPWHLRVQPPWFQVVLFSNVEDLPHYPTRSLLSLFGFMPAKCFKKQSSTLSFKYLKIKDLIFKGHWKGSAIYSKEGGGRWHSNTSTWEMET